MLIELFLATELAAQAPIVSARRELAPGVVLQPGGFAQGRGPDGNTIIFDAPDGLVVVDTGRHSWHSDAILAYAHERGRPIVAIINTHWHLDHSSGNGRLKAVYPNARVYTTSAIDRVIAPGGFLTRNLEGAQAMLASGEEMPGVQREEIRYSSKRWRTLKCCVPMSCSIGRNACVSPAAASTCTSPTAL
ncbi:MAG: MBL fold metallo-hydrolase [Caulobacteraceae bacterium]|nr:MBL fold metallo-hydrolase [Caulobacteraceae bacterium]